MFICQGVFMGCLSWWLIHELHELKELKISYLIFSDAGKAILNFEL